MLLQFSVITKQLKIMNKKHIIAHMKCTKIYAECSSCVRLKVGALIIKNNTPIAIGYNGTPTGQDNNCELPNGLSKSTVIHAEDNAFRKLIRSSENAIGASLFITHSPCDLCTQRIIDSGVTSIYYETRYRKTEGLVRLIDVNIDVYEVDIESESIKKITKLDLIKG